MAVSLDNIVNVEVRASSFSTVVADFNLGCIIGYANGGTVDGGKVYYKNSYATEMITDGYATTDDIYKKATTYFSQDPNSNRVYIAGMKEDEDVGDAFTRVKALNDKFYSFCFAKKLTQAEVLKVAALVEASDSPCCFHFWTDDEKCLQASQENVLKALAALSYKRTFGWYSTPDPGTTGLIDAAVVGIVSGLNSMTTNSAYTLAYKTLVGVEAENLSDGQLSALTSYSGNVYTAFGSQYNFTYPAMNATGYHVDEVYFVDLAKTLIQQHVVAGLTSKRKVPQTEDGVTTLISYVAVACKKLNEIGIIAGGIWRGDNILNLNKGDAIPNGYNIQSETIADQSDSDRAKRVSPPIYVALLGSGAIEHVVIQVYIVR